LHHIHINQISFSRFNITIKDQVLFTKIFGKAIDEARYNTAVGVKAAIYPVKADQVAGGLFSQCVVDV